MAPPLRPFFAAFNKMYGQAPFDDARVRELFVQATRRLGERVSANEPAGHAFLADDLFVWFRNLGFLRDEQFIAACGAYASDAVICARIWRVYVLCWAARSCLALDGDFADIGCYDGKTVEIMARYCDFAASRRKWFLYDLFENPPAEARKVAHGPRLHVEVAERLRGLGAFHIVKGELPGSLTPVAPERIAFLQIDLNVAAAELACLELLYDRVVPGGLLVLDDYGFQLHRDSYEAERRFFAQRGIAPLELPTGQGLLIKR